MTVHKVGLAPLVAALLAVLAGCTSGGPELESAAQPEAEAQSDGDEGEVESTAEPEQDAPAAEIPDASEGEAELVRTEFARTYDIDVEMIPIPDDPASIARGEHIANGWGYCAMCHFGPLFSGATSFTPYGNAFMVSAPNLTPGQGGIGSYYTDEDWIRTLRHGVKPSGVSVVAMPSRHSSNMSDEDLGALIAYLKSLEPVDRAVGPPVVRPEATLADLEDPDALPAAHIDHNAARPVAVEAAPTAEYGEYLVSAAPCHYCHGDQLNGKVVPLRGNPRSGNLTPGGDLADWTVEDFKQTVRTSITPEGEQLRQLFMPPHIYEEMTDVELEAIFAYLQTLPALEDGYQADGQQ